MDINNPNLICAECEGHNFEPWFLNVVTPNKAHYVDTYEELEFENAEMIDLSMPNFENYSSQDFEQNFPQKTYNIKLTFEGNKSVTIDFKLCGYVALENKITDLSLRWTKWRE
jgi:hypothetical protein